jgi:hypothetical protein
LWSSSLAPKVQWLLYYWTWVTLRGRCTRKE